MYFDAIAKQELAWVCSLRSVVPHKGGSKGMKRIVVLVLALIAASVVLAVTGIRDLGVFCLTGGGGLALLWLCLCIRNYRRHQTGEAIVGLVFIAAGFLLLAGFILFFLPRVSVLLMVGGMSFTLLGLSFSDEGKERAGHVILVIGVILIVAGFTLHCVGYVAGKMQEFKSTQTYHASQQPTEAHHPPKRMIYDGFLGESNMYLFGSSRCSPYPRRKQAPSRNRISRSTSLS